MGEGRMILKNIGQEQAKLYATSDYFPVAYRVCITGIVILDSSTLEYPDQEHLEPGEAVRLMESNDSLSSRYTRLSDDLSPGGLKTLIECLLCSTHPESERLLIELQGGTR